MLVVNYIDIKWHSGIDVVIGIIQV